jgi:hypothetical protein
VNEVIPARVKNRAAEMLRYHKKRGTAEAHTSNEIGEELYKLSVASTDAHSIKMFRYPALGKPVL